MRTAFDAENPPADVPSGATTACIYAGGDTPRPIADPEEVPVYVAEGVVWWLPGWVRSNPTPEVLAQDAQEFVAWLVRNKAPKGASTFLDLEGAATPAGVTAYGAALHAAGYKVLPYGDRSGLFRNPELDGYFVAAPGQEGLYPGSVATQYLYAGAYDLSRIGPTVELWPRVEDPPVPAPAPAPAPAEPAAPAPPAAERGEVSIANGYGWFALPAGTTADKVVSVDVDEQNPGDVGHYDKVPAYVGAATDRQSLIFGPGAEGAAPDGTYGFTYWVETA